MMDILERPRTVLEHRPEADHHDTLERDRMAAEQSTHTTIERWLPIPGYEGSYEVSDQGRVRSLTRTIVDRLGRPSRRSGTILRPVASKFGHLNVALWKDGKSASPKVHRIVMAAFVGPLPAGMETCHNNGDPTDNRLSNLRYDTRSSNSMDSVRHRTHFQVKKDHCPKGHDLSSPGNSFPSASKNGRYCRACSNAGTYVHDHPEFSGRKDEVADVYFYAYLTGQRPTPLVRRLVSAPEVVE